MALVEAIPLSSLVAQPIQRAVVVAVLSTALNLLVEQAEHQQMVTRTAQGVTAVQERWVRQVVEVAPVQLLAAM